MNRTHNNQLRPLGLSTVQAHILAALWIAGPLTIGELQKELALGSSTLTGAIDRMEKAELLSREPVVDDRRAWRIIPASWPKKRRQRVIDALTDGEQSCFGALSDAEHATLVDLLAKVSRAMETAEHD
jgi:DNA-binding MarR family transcriptional regulator